MDNSYDHFDSLDLDRLERVVATLKDHGVTRFRCGEVEISFEVPEQEGPQAGFIKPEDRASSQAAKADPVPTDGYGKAFRGALPKFKPASPKV